MHPQRPRSRQQLRNISIRVVVSSLDLLLLDIRILDAVNSDYWVENAYEAMQVSLSSLSQTDASSMHGLLARGHGVSEVPLRNLSKRLESRSALCLHAER